MIQHVDLPSTMEWVGRQMDFTVDRPRGDDDTVVLRRRCSLGGPDHVAKITGLDALRLPRIELLQRAVDQLDNHDGCQMELGPAGRPQ